MKTVFTLTALIGLALTQVIVVENTNELLVVALSGEHFDAWKSLMLRELELFAVTEGCTALRSISRRGIKPKLEKLGFEEIAVVLKKSLSTYFH